MWNAVLHKRNRYHIKVNQHNRKTYSKRKLQELKKIRQTKVIDQVSGCCSSIELREKNSIKALFHSGVDLFWKVSILNFCST